MIQLFVCKILLENAAQHIAQTAQLFLYIIGFQLCLDAVNSRVDNIVGQVNTQHLFGCLNGVFGKFCGKILVVFDLFDYLVDFCFKIHLNDLLKSEITLTARYFLNIQAAELSCPFVGDSLYLTENCRFARRFGFGGSVILKIFL